MKCAWPQYLQRCSLEEMSYPQGPLDQEPKKAFWIISEIPPASSVLQTNHRGSSACVGCPASQGCGQAAHFTGELAQRSKISSYEIIHIKILEEGKKVSGRVAIPDVSERFELK